MAILAVMQYVRSVLDDLAIPGQQQPLRAFIAPPDPDVNPKLTPRATVWSFSGHESRLAVGRAQPGDPSTGGRKTQDQKVQLCLWLPVADEQKDQDSRFPAVIDTVMAELRQTQSPVESVDTDGVGIQIAGLGEDMDWRLLPPYALAVQRWSMMWCEIIAPVLVEFQG